MLDAEQILTTAWRAVESSGVPQELQQTAFQLAVEITRGAAPSAAPVVPAPQQPVPLAPPLPPAGEQIPDPTAAEPSPASEDDLWAKFAEESDVDREELEALFYLADEQVHLNMKAHKLAPSKPSQMKAVAFALAVAYNFVFDRTALDTTVVRAESERLKCLDKKNFGTYMGSIEGLTTSGPASKRVLKMKSGAREQFKAWVAKMLADPAGDSA